MQVVPRRLATAVRTAEEKLSVALVFVAPVADAELNDIALVVPVSTAAVEGEDIVGYELVPTDSIDVVATSIVEIVCKTDVLFVAEDPEATKPLQMKATAITPARDSHVSSFLFGTLVFSSEHPASPYVAQSA